MNKRQAAVSQQETTRRQGKSSNRDPRPQSSSLSVRSVCLVAKLLIQNSGRQSSLAPSPTAPPVKPQRLTGDEA